MIENIYKKSLISACVHNEKDVLLSRKKEVFMTLQQLEYILALNKYRHFVKAAESCGITQSTLSLMIHKLEEELDIVIFDRNSHPIQPTLAGEEVLRQAQVVMYNARQLKEMTLSERKRISGDLHIGITPTIAPYIVPKLFSYLRQYYPDINLQPIELHRKGNVERLKNAEIDVAIMSMPEKDDALLEIPLYQERFVAYVSPTDPLYQEKEICYQTMPRDRAWALKNEICFQHQVQQPEGPVDDTTSGYESGSLVTLMQLVDELGGFTVIPELHIPLMTSSRRKKIRPLTNPVPTRQVSLFVRRDYVRETLLNVVADAIKMTIPANMMNDHLMKFKIRL